MVRRNWIPTLLLLAGVVAAAVSAIFLPSFLEAFVGWILGSMYEAWRDAAL